MQALLRAVFVVRLPRGTSVVVVCCRLSVWRPVPVVEFRCYVSVGVVSRRGPVGFREYVVEFVVGNVYGGFTLLRRFAFGYFGLVFPKFSVL